MSLIIKIIHLTILSICIGNTEAMETNYFNKYIPNHIEIIDGVEYVNAVDRNDTLMLKLGQKLFDNI